jgi:tRNA A37 threonylcarbamoyladenosine dehydratase
MTTLSSLNRHACATLEDVGSPKVIATQKFFKKIAPWAQFVNPLEKSLF